MKSFVLILLGIIVALLLIGGAVAYSFMNEMGVNIEEEIRNLNKGTF